MHRGSVYKYAQTGNLNGSYFWFGANVKSYLQLWYHGITWADSGSLFRVNNVSKCTSGAKKRTICQNIAAQVQQEIQLN